MYPPIWGSYYWKVIHMSCLSYPIAPNQNDKKKMYWFILSICNLLPCPQCRYHALQYLNTNKPKLDHRISLLYWSFDFHNEVNTQTGKRKLEYQECLDMLIATNVHEIVNTDSKRIEDHKLLSDIQTKLNRSETSLKCISSILAICLFVLGVLYYNLKKRGNK
jgi:hypothetical protein